MNRTLSALALTAALLVPVAASAQTQPAPPAPVEGHHHRDHAGMKHFLKDLNLTDAQKAQIKQIRENARAQRENEGQNADPAARRAAHEKMRADIEAVLTPEQRIKLQQEMQQWRATHPQPSR